MKRNWDRHFMNIAVQVSTMSTCLKKQVGAVLVMEKRVLATGHNGAPKGITHCTQCVRMEKDLKSYDVCPAVHAELNCIISCAYFGVSSKGATLYTMWYPCIQCLKACCNAGIKRIVYIHPPVDTTEALDRIVKDPNFSIAMCRI